MIVVAATASMLLQWRDEMAQKCGLDLIIARPRASAGDQPHPWLLGHPPRFVVSHSVLCDETDIAGLRDLLSGFRPASMLIRDEAHPVAPSSGGVRAVDSQMTREVREIAARFEHRLFLSTCSA